MKIAGVVDAFSLRLPWEGDESVGARSRAGEVSLPPIEGRTIQARHASYTGAVYAQTERNTQIAQLRRVWVIPRTLNEAADAAGIPLASVCRRKAEMEADLEFVEFQTIDHGPGKRTTKRARWQLKTRSVISAAERRSDNPVEDSGL